MSLVVYLAHPVAPRPEQHLFEVQAVVDHNLDSARTWLRWLITHTDWAVSMPWMPYVETLNDATSSHRHRGLRDDCLMASRCDAIILCGGRVSSGMAMERDAVQKAGKAVVSLVDLGPLPPSDDELAARRLGDAETLLRRRMHEATGG